MLPSDFQELRRIKKDSALHFQADSGQLLLCPDLGGRVFAELDGNSLHRIDLATVRDPSRPFNNFGGGNFWPAPEGGPFGFNYRGADWIVQPAINNQPFSVVSHDPAAAVIRKTVALTNRRGTSVEAVMERAFTVLPKNPPILNGCSLRGSITYQTLDSFKVTNPVSIREALLAAWTLEQFQATEHTVSFVVVANPAAAINFDFYEHPKDRIQYRRSGFLYRTDGRGKGQIGIKVAAAATIIGFYDRSRKLLCLRENRGPAGGVFFNIADNDQPGGPYSAADNYSIFNSDPDMAAFELETIGSAQVAGERLLGSELISVTTFALFENTDDLDRLITRLLGGE